MNQIMLLKIAVHTNLDAKTEIVCLSTYVSIYYPTFKPSQICTILEKEKDIKSHYVLFWITEIAVHTKLDAKTEIANF